MSTANKNQSGTVTKIGLAVLVTFGIYQLSAAQKAKNQQAAVEDIDKADSPQQQAALIKSYIGSWYENSHETDIISLAPKIKDWSAVVKAYQALYDENIEDRLRSVMNSSQYEQFISALQAKGRTITPTGYVAPKTTGTKKGGIIVIDDSTPVAMYKNVQDYPSKPLATVQKGKWNPKAKQVEFQQAYEFEYDSSSKIKTLLYQIKLSNSTLVWINGTRNVLKKKKGIPSQTGNGVNGMAINLLEVA